jgi:hypothetical protein
MFFNLLVGIFLFSVSSINAQSVSIISSYDGSVYNSTNNTLSSNFTIVPCPFGYYSIGNGQCIPLGICGILFGQCKCTNGYDWLCRCSCNIVEIILSNNTSSNTTISKPGPTRFPFTFPKSFSPKSFSGSVLLTTVASLVLFILV